MKSQLVASSVQQKLHRVALSCCDKNHLCEQAFSNVNVNHCRTFTLFSKSLPLDIASRVWDVFCRDGEAFLFRAALGEFLILIWDNYNNEERP